MKCERCVTDREKCGDCIDNPIYAFLPKKSKFTLYEPVCHLGYTECVHDPGYLKFVSPKWYKEQYGYMTPEEVVHDPRGCGNCTAANCFYDDEDK